MQEAICRPTSARAGKFPAIFRLPVAYQGVFTQHQTEFLVEQLKYFFTYA